MAVDAAARALDEATAAQRAAGDLDRALHVLTLIDRRVAVAAEGATAASREVQARRVAGAARARRDVAGEALAEAERLAPAAALAGHLVAGAPCPVCAQVVAALPAPHDDSAGHVAAVRAARGEADAAVAAAEDMWRSAERELAGIDARLAELDQQLAGQPERDAVEARVAELRALADLVDHTRRAAEEARRALAAIDADPDVAVVLRAERQAAEQLAAAGALRDHALAAAERAAAAVAGQPTHGEATAALETARELAAARAGADAAERDAAERRHRADVAHADAQHRERISREAYDDLRDRLSQLALAGGPSVAARPGAAPVGGRTTRRAVAPAPTEAPVPLDPLPARTERLADDWVAAVTWASLGRGRLATALAGLTAVHDGLAKQRSACLDALDAALAGRVPVDARHGRVDLAAVRRRLTDELVDARAAVGALEHERTRVRAVQAEITAWRGHAAVARLLGNLLRTDAFERWLLEEALVDLVSRANVRLHELTSGQYSLTAADGAFRVVDHRNADEVRDARSLSGGETFLTSLALALALADSSVDAAAQGSEPIESIFLDEGFGTLDPETLDVVAATIEELGSTGRMVGIITHIRELADRMPTKFEVTKGPRSSAIERVDV